NCSTSGTSASTRSSSCRYRSSVSIDHGGTTRPSFPRPSPATAARSTCAGSYDAAHRRGLAVLFDVVFNHAADADNSLWGMAVPDDKGIYLQDWRTPWGHAPAYWKDEVKAFFVDNAEMYFGEYGADGLRFDATRYIEEVRGLDNDGWRFLQHLTY